MSETTSKANKKDPIDHQSNQSYLAQFAARYGLLIIFVLVIGFFSILRPSSFASMSNIDNVMISEAATALLALGEMLVLSTNQFDLSIGYHLGMAQILVIGLQVNQGLSWPVAALIVIFIATSVGFINGLLVTRFGINSFIATMGVGTILYGVSNWYSGGQQILAMSLSSSYLGLSGTWFGIPLPALYVLAIALILWLVMERTPAGRGFYVIGSSTRAAELCGIPIKKYLTCAFTVSGLLCGIGGVLLGSVLETGTPSVGPSYLLPAFAAALLGGTSIHPGRVNVWGTILAILVLAFLFSGVQQLGANFYVQYFFNGGILVTAVGFSVFAANRRRKAMASGD